MKNCPRIILVNKTETKTNQPDPPNQPNKARRNARSDPPPSFSWAWRAGSTASSSSSRPSSPIAECLPILLSSSVLFPLLGSSPSACAFRRADPKMWKCHRQTNLKFSLDFGIAFCRFVEGFASQNGAQNRQRSIKKSIQKRLRKQASF